MITEKSYDVFLCHNSKDKPEVRQVYYALKSRGFTPWIDEVDLSAGDRWREKIEDSLERAGTAAVFVGKDNGRIQARETDICIDLESKGRLKIIPVILPGCDDDSEIDAFLRTYTWVDFRKTSPDPLDQLCKGICEVEHSEQPTIAVAPSIALKKRSRLIIYAQSAGLSVPRAGIYPTDAEQAAQAFADDLEESDVVVRIKPNETTTMQREGNNRIKSLLETYPHQNRVLSWSQARSTFAEFQKVVIDRAQRAYDANRSDDEMKIDEDADEKQVDEKKVMIKYHKDDFEAARELVKHLKTCKVGFSSSRNGKTTLADRMREYEYDALIVVLGKCDDEWLEERSLELIEVELTLKEQVPLQVFYYADGTTALPPDMSPNALEINGRGELDKLCREIQGRK